MEGTERRLPVCPRHPDRPSFIRCQRCGQPTCTECQRPAAVGIHCVDCVAGRTSAGAVGGARPDSWGQRPDAGPVISARAARPVRRSRPGGQPWVTWTMIGLCVLVYALQWITSGQSMGVTEQFYYAGLHTSAVEMQPYRMLTSAFLHSLGNPLHIVLNLYTLWLMGRMLEPLLGWARFLALYLVSALGGSVAVLLLSHPYIPVVGASGAVYGLFAALFIVTRQSGGNVTGIAALIGINLVISFVPGANISWQGHVGGLVAGAACALAMAYLPRRRQGSGWLARPVGRTAAVQWTALAVIVAVLVVLTLVGVERLSLPALIEYSDNR